MPAHILDQPPQRQIPKTDPSILIRARHDLATRTTRQRRDASGMAREHPHRIPIRHIPHSDRLVTTGGEDIGGVGVESNDVDTIIVAG